MELRHSLSRFGFGIVIAVATFAFRVSPSTISDLLSSKEKEMMIGLDTHGVITFVRKLLIILG